MHDTFDFIFAGGGLAGLSLANYLQESSLRGRRILIIDSDQKNKNDRTWCYWSPQKNIFDPAVYRSWQKLRFTSSTFEKVFDLSPYHYNMIRGQDFYRLARTRLENGQNITFLQGNVEDITDSEQGAVVQAGGKHYHGHWVFDSLFRASEFKPVPGKYHYLKQHFRGWTIHTPKDSFDPKIPVLFDFRTPQSGNLRFCYVLPVSTRSALVEYTLFSADLLKSEEYDTAISAYIGDQLGIGDYTIEEVENGIIPMTDQPFPRRLGDHILAIGTKGGLVKPSSGYAFTRIQKDCTRITTSLVRNGHPFQVQSPALRYRLFDTIMLQVMHRQGKRCEEIFTGMFSNNPIHKIFRFLDEDAGILENISLIASLPPWPFLKASGKVLAGNI